MSQLFFRRHYETIARVLGVAHRHVKSPIAAQTVGLITRMFAKVFMQDSAAFRADLFKQSVLRAASDIDDDEPVDPVDPPKTRGAIRRESGKE